MTRLTTIRGLALGLILTVGASAAMAQTGPASTTKPAVGKFTISKETTYVTGPLNADGTINYLTVLNNAWAKGVDANNNAAVVFAQCLPMDANDRAWLLRQLGAPHRRPIGRLESISSYYLAGGGGDAERRADQAQEQLGKAMAAPWTADQYPLVAEYLKAMDKPQAALQAAIRLPNMFLPVRPKPQPSALSTLGVGWGSPFRPLADVWAARAMLKAGQGRMDAAVDDLLNVLRLGRLVGSRGTMSEWCAGEEIEDVGFSGIQSLTTSGKLTGPQASAALTRLGSISPPPELASLFDLHHRLMLLDELMVFIRTGLPIDKGGTRRIQLEWDVVLKTANSLVDRAVAALRKPTFAQAQQVLHALQGEIEQALKQAGVQTENDGVKLLTTYSDRPEAERTKLSRIIILGATRGQFPDLVRFHEIAYEDRARLDLLKVALALAACRAANGKYPQMLGALSPRYIKRVPDDPFTGKPLVYKAAGKGYLLYSVGPNMKDDGARRSDVDVTTRPFKRIMREQDDISIEVK